MVAVLLSPCAAGGAKRAPLICPSGTKLEKIDKRPKEPAIQEFCVDFRTHRREGPTRWLDPDGALLALGQYEADKLEGTSRAYTPEGKVWKILTYSGGHMTGERLTRAGLVEMVRIVNADIQKSGMKSRMELLDDHTLLQTFTLAPLPPGSPHKPELLRQGLLAQPEICQVFVTPSDLEQLITVYRDAGGKEIVRVPISRTWCANR